MRVGIGYDVHRLVVGRPLRLGGVDFDYHLGLDGHSDADVVMHAICDALLGAAALRDIGYHFPPGDERFRGIDSIELLRSVCQILAEAGWRANNVDVSVVAEAPRINPRVSQMQAAISAVLGLDPGAISVKATTNEQLGFVGRGEGIAAMAVATIVPHERGSIDSKQA